MRFIPVAVLMVQVPLRPPQGIYEYGDHGGLLLMASHETEGPADSLQFSLDQGACWHTIHLSEAIDIQNIR